MVADFGLKAFQESELGRRVEKVLSDRENLRDMMALCRNDLPAVRAVGKQLLKLGLTPKNETEKKLIGRWVQQLMAVEGWMAVRKGKISRGNLFSTGAIYQRRTG